MTDDSIDSMRAVLRSITTILHKIEAVRIKPETTVLEAHVLMGAVGKLYDASDEIIAALHIEEAKKMEAM